MRGPSSSHCAASLRIARLGRDLMNGDISQILIEFDQNGSLATTHKDQGSDMGLFGGSRGSARRSGSQVTFRTNNYAGANSYILHISPDFPDGGPMRTIYQDFH